MLKRLSILLYTTLVTIHSADVLYYNNMDEGTGWYITGNARKYSSIHGVCDIPDCVGISNDGTQQTSIIQPNISTNGYTNIQLQYSIFAEGLESGDYCIVSYSVNGLDFSILEQYGYLESDQLFRAEIKDMGIDANNQQNISIKFATNTNSDCDECYIDEVYVLGISITTSPTKETTNIPTTEPTFIPTMNPTNAPTNAPIVNPTTDPTPIPSTSTNAPTTYSPTILSAAAIPTSYEPTTHPPTTGLSSITAYQNTNSSNSSLFMFVIAGCTALILCLLTILIVMIVRCKRQSIHNKNHKDFAVELPSSPSITTEDKNHKYTPRMDAKQIAVNGVEGDIEVIGDDEIEYELENIKTPKVVSINKYDAVKGGERDIKVVNDEEMVVMETPDEIERTESVSGSFVVEEETAKIEIGHEEDDVAEDEFIVETETNGIEVNDEEKDIAADEFIVETDGEKEIVTHTERGEQNISDDVDNDHIQENVDSNNLDSNLYESWNHENIIVWILSIEEGRFKKYEQMLRQRMAEEELKGKDLGKVEMNDIKEWGIKIFADKKCLYGHIQSLIKEGS